MSVILAGPWVGEFGWELFCWQAYLRYLSEKGNKIIVVSRDTSRFLHEDFCHRYIPFNPLGTKMDSYKCIDMKGDFSSILSSCKFDRHLDPRNREVFYSGDKRLCKNFSEQKFIKFGVCGAVVGYDIILHARNTEKCGTFFRNWKREKWDELVSLLKRNGLSVASMGTQNDAMYIDGTQNLIGCGLKKISDIMANSGMIIGPSSGPMHFASLCGLSQVVWSESKNRNKYLYSWNPFKVKVSFYDTESWDPKVNTVYKLIEDMRK